MQKLINLKKIRNAIGMTQKELAEKVDVSESFISQLENLTKSPSFDVALKIAEVLGCESADLVTERDGLLNLIEDKKIPATESDEYNEKHKEINALFDLCSPSDQELAIGFLKRLAQHQSDQDVQKESD